MLLSTLIIIPVDTYIVCWWSTTFLLVPHGDTRMMGSLENLEVIKEEVTSPQEATLEEVDTPLKAKMKVNSNLKVSEGKKNILELQEIMEYLSLVAILWKMFQDPFLQECESEFNSNSMIQSSALCSAQVNTFNKTSGNLSNISRTLILCIIYMYNICNIIM